MRIYTVHLRREGLNPDTDLILVREGFSLAATLFSVLWALWHRLWLVAAVIAVIDVAIGFMMRAAGATSTTQVAISVGLALLIGCVGNDLWRWTLRGRGFVDAGVVAGENAEMATRRFLDRRPMLAAEMAG